MGFPAEGSWGVGFRVCSFRLQGLKSKTWGLRFMDLRAWS